MGKRSRADNGREGAGPGRIIVAMSGGVDSSVAAALLKDAGHEVIGLYMKTGVEVTEEESARKSCCSATDAVDARRVAAQLDIPFYTLDFSRPFGRIIEYFIAEYNQGRTPIPCAVCNQWVKFGELLEFARDLETDVVATGHYARIVQRDGRYVLSRPRDTRKDQTYFLFPLNQDQLARIRFPLADLTKDEVRGLARKYGLPVAVKQESQEICFVPKNDYRELLRERSPGTLAEGEIVDIDGKVVGTHSGYQNFTIGQRKGIGIGGGTPFYVVALDPEANRVVVGGEDDLGEGALVAMGVTWIGREPLVPGDSLSVRAQVRYNHEPTPATMTLHEDGQSVRVAFDAPERAITPGQACVLYEGDEVVAGGWIADLDPAGAIRSVPIPARENPPFAV